MLVLIKGAIPEMDLFGARLASLVQQFLLSAHFCGIPNILDL
jgi:hypothetical protein